MPNTPLYMAVYNGHAEAVKLLLMHGATTSHIINADMTYLQYAVRRNNIDLIEALLLHSDIDEESGNGRTALHIATIAGHIDVIRLLLKYKPNVNTWDCYYDTPMDDAIRMKNNDIIELLRSHGARSNWITLRSTHS